MISKTLEFRDDHPPEAAGSTVTSDPAIKFDRRFLVDPSPEEVSESIVTRRGPYWSSPEFDSIIAFEAAFIRYLRMFSRNYGLERDEVVARLNRIQSGFSQELFDLWRNKTDPIIFLIGFLDQWKRILRRTVTIVSIDENFSPTEIEKSLMMRLTTGANDACNDAKQRLRNNRQLMIDETYWPPEKRRGR